MLKEQKGLATIKNLENQFRLFLYEHSYLSKNPNNFIPVIHLLSNVTPIQYLLKELIVTNDGERAEELSNLIGGHLYEIQKEFRLLSKRTIKWKVSVRDIWYALYEVYLELDYFITDILGDVEGVEEFEPFLAS